MNIVNKQGVFTWNSSPNLPLEQMGNELTKEKHGDASAYKFCNCYNIHKNLEGYVRNKLNAAGITEDFIYPNPTKIAKEIITKSTT